VKEFHLKKDELINATSSFVGVSTNERRVIGHVHDNFVLGGFVNVVPVVLILELLVHMVIVQIMLMFLMSLLFMLFL
jgi:hypothetical protein